MSADESWARGVIDGYRSVSPGVTPGIPGRPAAYPASLRNDDVDDYYYRLGYEAGREMAHS